MLRSKLEKMRSDAEHVLKGKACVLAEPFAAADGHISIAALDERETIEVLARYVLELYEEYTEGYELDEDVMGSFCCDFNSRDNFGRVGAMAKWPNEPKDGWRVHLYDPDGYECEGVVEARMTVNGRENMLLFVRLDLSTWKDAG